MKRRSKASDTHSIRAHVREFAIPPIHDALVLGRHAPIGCKAFRKALDLLMAQPFEHIELDDPVVNDLLVRAAILRRVPQDKLVAFVLQQVKPLMGADEVLHLDLDIRVTVEGSDL